jgi:deoxyribodipyrimidine photolyase-related protein
MIYLIFPVQLFSNMKHLKNAQHIYLIEEPRYFTDFAFHKLKLAYHRATMKAYYDKLKKKFKPSRVSYINFADTDNQFYTNLAKTHKSSQIYYMDTADLILNAKLDKLVKNIIRQDTINFLIKPDEFQDIKQLIINPANNRYSHDKFYKHQRLKLNILLDKNQKPLNQKWTFDTENRLPLPKDHIPVPLTFIKPDKYLQKIILEAKTYTETNFPNNYGTLDNFIYPINSRQALSWLVQFLKKRLSNFGTYQDAVSDQDTFIYHSVLSPMMNVGLLTDMQIVKISNAYYLSTQSNQSKKTKISIQSYEGFIRQLIGWRNYVYLLYNLERDNLFESNQLNHTNKINKRWWTASLDIPVLDHIINKIINYSYAHHIERLMYLGNFMLLCQIHPKEVYRIFMEWTIDAYDWVMVPNIFGMSQFSTDIMMTRPYFSSYNYIIKMSTFKIGDWSEIWQALYYTFIGANVKLLKKNYAIAQQVNNWKAKSDSDKKKFHKIKQTYLKTYIN